MHSELHGAVRHEPLMRFSHMMLRALSAGCFCALLLNCSQPEATKPNEKISVRATALMDTSLAAWFGGTGIDSVYAACYAGALRQMDEQPFPMRGAANATPRLRFVYIRAFHPPIAVRVMPETGECAVTTSVLGSAQFEYAPPDSNHFEAVTKIIPGQLIRRDSVRFAAQACHALETALADPAFWSNQSSNSGQGVDGSEWLIERVDAAGHQALERWSPDSVRQPRIWRAGLEFLRLGRALPATGELY